MWRFDFVAGGELYRAACLVEGEESVCWQSGESGRMCIQEVTVRVYPYAVERENSGKMVLSGDHVARHEPSTLACWLSGLG